MRRPIRGALHGPLAVLRPISQPLTCAVARATVLRTHDAGMDPRHAPSVGRVLSDAPVAIDAGDRWLLSGSSGDTARPHAERRSHRS